jgi:hypothetical protein
LEALSALMVPDAAAVNLLLQEALLLSPGMKTLPDSLLLA